MFVFTNANKSIPCCCCCCFGFVVVVVLISSDLLLSRPNITILVDRAFNTKLLTYCYCFGIAC